MNVPRRLAGFMEAHRGCGLPRAKTEPTITDGYLLWIDCPCGASFERWVASNEDEQLLRSALRPFET